MLYDAFELQKVGEFDGDEGEILCEPIFDDADEDTYLRVYWTIYGHKPEGGVEALIDCNDENRAIEIYDFFCNLSAIGEAVIKWAKTGKHDGNPYMHEFVKLALAVMEN